MIKNISFTLLVFTLFHTSSVFASFLNEQIESFFQQQLSDIAVNININYLNQKVELDCDTPSLSLANKNKYWGDVMIIAQCGEKKAFIKLNVAVEGNYVVASHPISTGDKLSNANTRVQYGRLDTLPQGVAFKVNDILNYVAQRNINSDQPIKSSMIRKAWKVRAGQTVKVIISGDSYQIETMGKALTNATLSDNVNVRINATKVVEGIVMEQGVVIFDKKN